MAYSSGNTIANVSSALSGEGVNYTSVPLDPGTQGLINTDTQVATQPTNQVAGLLNANVAARGGQALQSEAQSNQEAAGLGESPGMLNAIRMQYGQAANQNIQNIMRTNQLQAPLTQSEWLKGAASEALAQQQVETNNYEMLTNAYNAATAARAQALNSILNLGGSLGALASGSHAQNKTSANGESNTNTFSVEAPA
jgi:hypothetical protein